MENKLPLTEEAESKWQSIMLKLYLNLAQTYLILCKPKKTIYYCKQALDYDSDNVKALFRYGHSLRILQDFDRSRKFLLRAYKLKPGDKSISEEIDKLDQMVSKYKYLEKDIYKKMFKSTTSMASIDEEKPKIVEIENEDESDMDLINLDLDDKASIARTKQRLLNKLKEFKSNPDLVSYHIQIDMFPTEIMNYIKEQADSLNLTLRSIKGVTNTIQIMKND
jgi:tetratricopeptide (TPR) repeat protein